jgi:hypothetical protein
MAYSETQGRTGTATPPSPSPVDDHTYNVLQALTSTLESIDAYARYEEDGGSELFGRLADEEQEHARLLLDELRSCLGATSERQ